ncbi:MULTISPECIES: sulfur oxidation c-type cytochrome SoxA [unclassified Roseibium]|uniref:sulfur oxidation c-type cytochrome SoxA n=1 Tax=unclassified Roseibium TaxID=2629323 RepID=UPI0027401507|nr:MULTISPECIES: sulfur oxidation c-type cytochrome SoxA [unclassified Roseibium]
MTKNTGRSAAAILATGLVLGMSNQSVADENAELIVEGEQLVTKVAAPEGHPLDELLSGWRFRSDETQALQTDDFENPAFAAVDYGSELWETEAGTSGKSCASCHGDASESMKGLRASMPKWHEGENTLMTLEDHINWSRKEHQGADPWKWESAEMLAMTAFLGLQSRGMPVNVKIDGPAKEWFNKGKDLYYTRVGQLDMSCSNCHEDNYGNMIRADHLSQGQINGFPTYRLKWQGLGSTHRRFKGCMDNIRATPFKRGSDEFTSLELYLAWRGSGLSVETPAVRQ